jgi:hypothetical protein
MTSDDTTSEHQPERTANPIPLRGPRWNRAGRLGVGLVAAVAVVALIGGAVAWASNRGAGPNTVASSQATSGAAAGHQDAHDHDASDESLADSDQRAGERAASGRHHHTPLAPYAQRYGEATQAQQASADDLLADVRTTLATYANVDAAVAAGYRAPKDQRGPLAHYLNPTTVRAGRVLDPAHPNGLVYYTGGSGKPVLLGAFYVAPARVVVPDTAGNLVVWHSHNEDDCPQFFATKDDPCIDSRRMLHVWTVGEVELGGGRRRHRPALTSPATVKVVDPFGVPFGAAVERKR